MRGADIGIVSKQAAHTAILTGAEAVAASAISLLASRGPTKEVPAQGEAAAAE